MVARNAAPDNPQKREKRHSQAKQEFGVLERCRPLEVVEVDALRELLGCPRSCHWLANLTISSIAQRHDRMYRAEQNQRERKRNVQQHPAVQPAVQLLLACKLAGLLANVFEVGERAVRPAGQQSAQGGKGAARGSRLR